MCVFEKKIIYIFYLKKKARGTIVHVYVYHMRGCLLIVLPVITLIIAQPVLKLYLYLFILYVFGSGLKPLLESN